MVLHQSKISCLRLYDLFTEEKILNLRLSQFSSDARYDRVQYECIRCMAATMNNTVGIRTTFECKEAIPVLARSLNVNKPHCALEAAKVRIIEGGRTNF